MASAAKYLSNVAKSVKYVAVDAVKAYNPVIVDMAESNADVYKAAYTSIRNYRSTVKRISKAISKSQVGELAVDLKHNILEDLKNGTFYNRERENRILDSAVADSDMMNDNMDDFSVDFGEDDDFSVGDFSVDDTDMASVIDEVGEKTSNAVNQVLLKTSEYQVEATRQSTVAVLTQQTQMSNMINNGLHTLNANIGNMITFNNEAMSTHIENSRLFYDTTKQQLEEQTSVLKEMLELQKKIFTPNKSASNGTRIKVTDIFTSEGAINLADYFAYVQQNAKDNDMGLGGMLEALQDSGGIATLAANPVGAVLKTVVQGVIPDVLKESMKSFNEAIRGGIATGLLKLGQESDYGSGIMSAIGSLFGVNVYKKNRLDTSKYNKEAVPWNGKDHKALTEVIPDLLGKIYSTLSGSEQKIYDYEKGKYISKKQIKRNYDSMQNMYVRNANASLTPEINNQLSKVSFYDEKERKQFLKDLDTVMKTNFDRGTFFNPKDKYQNEKYYGLKGKNAKYNMKLIRKIWNNISPEKKMQANYDLIEAMGNQNDYMRRLEDEGDSIFLRLFDDSDDPDIKKLNKKGRKRQRKIEDKRYKENVKKMKKGLMGPVYDAGYKIDTSNNLLLAILKTTDKITTLIGNSGGDNKGKKVKSKYKDADINDFIVSGDRSKHKKANKKKKKNDSGSGDSDDSDGSHISKKDATKTAERLYKELFREKSEKITVIDPISGKSKFKNIMNNPELRDAIIGGIKTSNPEVYKELKKIIDKEGTNKTNKEVRDIVNALDEQYYSGRSTKEQIAYELEQLKQLDPDLYKSILKDKKLKRKGKGTVSDITGVRHSNFNGSESTMSYGGKINLTETKPSERAKYRYSDFITDIRDADTAMGKIKAFFGGTKYLLDSPAKFVSGVLKKADMRLYNVLFGTGNDDEFSITGKIMNGFDDWFDNLKEKTSDTFEKIQDAFMEVGIKDKVVTLFKNMFGVSLDIWGSEFKKAMFGKENVSFGEGMQEVFSQGFKEIGNGFKEFFGFGPKSKDKNKEQKPDYLYTVRGVKKGLGGYTRDVLAGRKTKKGEQKQEYIDHYGDLVNAFNRAGRARHGSLWSNNTKKQKKYDEYNDWDIQNAASGMRRVSKTGVVAVSEGELIVPPDLNPDNISKREKNEKSAISRFQNTYGDMNIPMFNAGGTPGDDGTGETKKDTNKEQAARDIFNYFDNMITTGRKSVSSVIENLKAYEKTDPELYKYFGKIAREKYRNVRKENRFTHEDYEEGHENLAIRVTDELGNVVNAILDTDLAKSVTSKLNDSIGQDAKDAAKDTVLNLNKYLPTMAAAGTTGMALSLMLGLAGGPLVGGAVGAGLALVKKSENVQKLLFGNEVTDEEGNTRRDGTGLLSKNLVSHIDKYFPNMSKSAIVGGIASILPFVPGGPVAGVLLGSAIGFARTNEEVRRTFFGSEEKAEKLKEKVQKMAPRMAIGAVASALTGPFGLTTNLLVGAGLGFVSDTEKFKQLVFGNEGLDGKRYGGIMGFIKDSLEVPLEGIKDLFGMAKDTLKNDIFDPIVQSLQPITQQVANMVHAIGDKIHDSISTHIVRPIGKMVTDILRPFQKLGNTIVGTMFKTMKTILLSPLKLLRAATGKLEERQLGKMGANDMMTLQQRMNKRREIDEKRDKNRDILNKAFKTDKFSNILGGRDKLQNTDAARLDEFLSSASKEEIQDFYRLQQSIDPNTGKKISNKKLAIRFEKNLGLDKLLAAEANFMIRGTAGKIRNAVRSGDFDKARKAARAGFTDPERAEMMVKWLDNKEKEYSKLKDTWAASEAKLAMLEEKTGIKGLNKRAVGRTVKEALYERFGEDANATLSEQLAKDRADKEKAELDEQQRVIGENSDKLDTLTTTIKEANKLLNAFIFPDSKEAKELRQSRQYKEDKEREEQKRTEEQKKLREQAEIAVDDMGTLMSSGPVSKNDLISFINSYGNNTPGFSNIQDAKFGRIFDEYQDKKDKAFQERYRSKENKEDAPIDYEQITAVNTLVNSGDLAGARDIINGRVKTSAKFKSVAKRLFNKIKNKVGAPESVVTEHGVVKMGTNSQGEQVLDERDSVTRETIKRRDENANNQKSLLQKISGIGDGLKGLFGGNDDSDDDEHKGGLLSSILGIAKAGLGLFGGKGLTALGITGATLLASGIAGTNVQVKKRDKDGNIIYGMDGQPVMETKILAEAVEDAVSHAWFGWDGTGETDGVWFKIKGFAKDTLLPTLQKLWLGDDLSGAVSGLWYNIKTLATEHMGPAIKRGMTWFITDALPGLLKTFVKTIPSLIGAVASGVTSMVADAIRDVLPSWMGGKSKKERDTDTLASEGKNKYSQDKKYAISQGRTSSTSSEPTFAQMTSSGEDIPVINDYMNSSMGFSDIQAKDTNTAVAELNDLDLGLGSNTSTSSTGTYSARTSSSNSIESIVSSVAQSYSSRNSGATNTIGETSSDVYTPQSSDVDMRDKKNIKDQIKNSKAYANVGPVVQRKVLNQLVSVWNSPCGSFGTVGDLLNNDSEVAFTLTDPQTGEDIYVTGADILKYPQLAEMLGIDVAVTEEERQQRKESMGYDIKTSSKLPNALIRAGLQGQYAGKGIKAARFLNNKALGAAEWAVKHLPGGNSIFGKGVQYGIKGVKFAKNIPSYLAQGTSHLMSNVQKLGWKNGVTDTLGSGIKTIKNAKNSVVNRIANPKTVKGKIASKLFGKAKDVVKDKSKTLITKFSKIIDKFFTNNKVVNFFVKAVKKIPLKKAGRKVSESGIKKVLKQLGDWMVKKFTTGIVKKAASAVAKVAKKLTAAIPVLGQVITIGFVIADFTLGVKNADMIFGVMKPTLFERAMAGIINAICENLTFNLFFTANDVVEFVVKLLEGLGVDMSKLRERQSDAEAAKDKWNDEHDTNLSTKEFLAKDKMGTKIKNAIGKLNPFKKKDEETIIESVPDADDFNDNTEQVEPTATETILNTTNEQYEDLEKAVTYSNTIDKVNALESDYEEDSGVVTNTYYTQPVSSGENVTVSATDVVSGTGSIITPQNQQLIQQAANEINGSIPSMIAKMKQNIAKYLGIDTYELDKQGKDIGKDRFDNTTGPMKLMKNIIRMWSRINSIVSPLTGNLPKNIFYAIKGLSSFLNGNFNIPQDTIDAYTGADPSAYSNTTSTNSNYSNSTVYRASADNTASRQSYYNRMSTNSSTSSSKSSSSSSKSTSSSKSSSILSLAKKGLTTALKANPITAPIMMLGKLFSGGASGLAGNQPAIPQHDLDSENFISQKYSSYANKKFMVTGDKERVTVKDAGCAPAAATMVINSNALYEPITMDQAIRDSLKYKEPEGGVTADYFVDEFDKHGINSTFITNKHSNMKQSIVDHIRRGRKIILMGQDPNNRSKKNSPFGPTDHYVVATGVSEDGSKLIINDPEAREGKIEYDKDTVLSKVKLGVIPTLKNKRKASKSLVNKAKSMLSKFSGQGPMTIIYVGDFRVQAIQKTVNPSNTKFIIKPNAQALSGAKSQIIDAAISSTNPVLVFSCGMNDITKANDYLAIYKSLKSNSMLKNKKMFFLSLNPVRKPPYKGPLTNYSIQTFNNSMTGSGLFTYIDTFSTLLKGGFESVDGLNYPKSVNEFIHKQVLNVVGGGNVNSSQYSKTGTFNPDASKDAENSVSSSTSSSSNSSTTTTEETESGPLSPLDYLNGIEGNIKGISGFLSTLDALAAAYGLTSLTSSSGSSESDESGSGGSTHYSSAGISGNVSSDPDIAEKQVQVLAAMRSLEGTLDYSQTQRNPESGSGDCSSTVQWAYNKVMGIDVGSWTGAQETSPNTYFIEQPHCSGAYPTEDKMQLGDLILYGGGAGRHVEMYNGDGTTIGHGGGQLPGPFVAPISNQGTDCWSVKRLNEFKSDGSAKYSGKGSGLDFVSQLDSKYKNMSFGDETIAEAGCAPVVAVMAENAYSDKEGKGPNLRNVINRAKQYKGVGEGVTADFFIDEFDRSGYSSIVTRQPENIYKSLRQNKPVVLLGQDTKNKSKKKSPFGPNSHYVLATGISEDGNTIYIHDPEARRGYMPYRTSNIEGAIQMGIRPILKGANKKADEMMLNIKSALGNIRGNATGAKSVSSKYGSDTPQYIVWNTLRANGYNEAATAAVMGNIEAECNFRADAIESGNGVGFGLIQWSYDRRTALENAAAAKGVSPSDIKFQTEYLLQEMNTEWIDGGGPSYGFRSYTKSDLLNATPNTIDDATLAFMCCFERPSYDPNVNHYTRRCEAARQYYKDFTGTTIDTSLSFDSSGSSTTSSSTAESGEPKVIEAINMFDELAEKYGLVDSAPEMEGDGSSTGSSSSNSSGSTSISGGSDKAKVWNYLHNKGIPDNGIAGLMGNLQAESGIQFNNAENAYENITGGDVEYTEKIDSGKVDLELFKHPWGDGESVCGYGLAQWTTPGRKEGLWGETRAKNRSIADPQGQMDWLWKELNDPYYAPTLNAMKSGSIDQASDAGLSNFEAPRNWETQIQSRRDNAHAIYNELHGSTSSSTDSSEKDSRKNNINSNTGKPRGKGSGLKGSNKRINRPINFGKGKGSGTLSVVGSDATDNYTQTNLMVAKPTQVLSSNTDTKPLEALLKVLVRLLSQVVDNTSSINTISELMVKLLDIQSRLMDTSSDSEDNLELKKDLLQTKALVLNSLKRSNDDRSTDTVEELMKNMEAIAIQ